MVTSFIFGLQIKFGGLWQRQTLLLNFDEAFFNIIPFVQQELISIIRFHHHYYCSFSIFNFRKKRVIFFRANLQKLVE